MLHAVIMAGDRPVAVEHLPQQLASSRPGIVSTLAMPSGAMTLREVERQIVLGVLEKHNGDKRLAAAELGIALKTMYNKLNQYNATAVDESPEIISTD
mgnify:CR=1 FL=1